ncbi:hypothetical protein [Oscillibacter sp. GMB15532]|uniref:hypothetical protein n=1 Tax=Oscillibacter sp. GMB15532 TaxID=3230022 RepID=UPI0034DF5F35
MENEMRTFGYLCPACGKPVMAARSLFALEASGVEVECGCGGSALRTEFDGQRCKLFVPCGLCGETHTARCAPEELTREGGVAFGCANSQEFCCYVGDEGSVEKHLRTLEVLAEKEKRNQENGGEPFLDSVIMYEVLSELKEIAARENGITCGCGSHDYAMDIRRSAVDLSCKDCGAKLRIPAATEDDLDDLCCHLRLTIPGGV